MGNYLALCRPRIGLLVKVVSSHGKVLKIVKEDGRILEFSRPILVKDVLVKFSGLGIGLSKESLELLPQNSELKLGKVYYLLPSVKAASSTPVLISPLSNGHQQSTGKRIKVVITKQQLEMLMRKQKSLDEVLSLALERRRSNNPSSSSGSWKPKLESIPEAGE